MRRYVGKGGTCTTGKMRFRDHESAQRAMINRQRKAQGRPPTRVYECPKCQGWHMTGAELKTPPPLQRWSGG